MTGAAKILLLAMLIAAPLAHAQTPAPQQAASNGPIYAVTYFEVAPAAAVKTAGVLRQFANDARKADGNIEFTALQQIGRAGHFAFVEAWRDKAALDAHASAAKTLSETLKPVFAAPFDIRQFWTLSVRPTPAGATRGRPVYVLTHVDVFPAGKDEAAAMLKQLVEDSRKEPGAVRFDAIVQDAHPNHFHLIETWANDDARQAHALAGHTRQFRAQLVPLEGALYDERLFTELR